MGQAEFEITFFAASRDVFISLNWEKERPCDRSCIQLFRERLSNKDNATMLKGIMGNVVSWTSIETLFVSAT